MHQRDKARLAGAVEPSTPPGPLYKQVVERLRRDIVDGKHQIGALLPTEAELAETYGVSRHTIREALRQLRADGLINSRQGSGTTVTGAASPKSFVHEVGTIANLVQYASALTFTVRKTEMLLADEELAGRLSAPVASSWLSIVGLRHSAADGNLVSISFVYVPAEFAGISRLVGPHSGAIYELIEARYGVRISEVTQQVHARVVPVELAQDLGVEQGSIVIEVIRTYKLQSGKTAELAVNLYPPEQFNMTLTLRSKNG